MKSTIRSTASVALLGVLALASPAWAQSDPRSTLEADALGPVEISAGAAGASFVSADVPASRVRMSGDAGARELASAMLGRYGGVLGLDDAASQLTYDKTETDDLGQRHVRYHQVIGGLPVLNAEVTVHLDGDGLHAITSGVAPARTLADAGGSHIDAVRAETLARTRVPDAVRQGEPELVAFAGVSGERSDARAAWVLDLASASDLRQHKAVVVDAVDGRILAVIERAPDSEGHHGTPVAAGAEVGAAERERASRPAAPDVEDALPLPPPPPPPPPGPACQKVFVDTFNAFNQTTNAVSTLRYREYVIDPETPTCGKKTFGSTTDASVNQLHPNAMSARAHFINKHKFNGWDGAAATTRAVANYGTDDNAFWTGTAIVFYKKWGVLDVVGHEYGHAVDDHTARLTYWKESGALDESFADASGWDMDPGDATLGENLPGGALRNMDWPHLLGQPEKVSGWLCTNNDSGGVHTNSGIPNWAYSWMVWYMGRSDAQKIRFRAHKVYLGPSSGFAAARNAYIQAAKDLGLSSSLTTTSWDWTGVTSSWKAPC